MQRRFPASRHGSPDAAHARNMGSGSSVHSRGTRVGLVPHAVPTTRLKRIVPDCCATMNRAPDKQERFAPRGTMRKNRPAASTIPAFRAVLHAARARLAAAQLPSSVRCR